MTKELDAATLVGLLADDDRRRAFAALELGADTIGEVGRVSGLSGARTARAVGRLADAGLVVDDSGALHVIGAAFQVAARAALARPASTEHHGLPVEARRVMDAFVADGRLLSIPMSHGKRLVVLDWLAQDFDPGRRYTEAMVNLIIGTRHADTAALRRHLVDEGYLAREAGEYWRIGGTTEA